MKILSPRDLSYPITVVDLLKQPGEDVKRSEKLFSYRYETEVSEGDRWGGWQTKKKKLITKYDSNAVGQITQWLISPGTVIERQGTPLVEIEEPCTHETQFGGLCAECGEDMTKIDYLTKERDVTRATINMTHDNIALLVSKKEANAAEEDAKKRLLGAKKLTLIVDLDQTVIHTTCERTIAEWQDDPENPNHDAVKDVEGFQLADDNVSNVAANWYYVKMRPGLKDFFSRISKLYEMHVYTMATRAYAQAVCKIIDPDRRYFGDRILSRDENYTDKTKSLSRLFQSTTMVVIIDDRADVWQYSPHLVRVPVFNFFPGAGDINASFLPKQQELVFAKDKVPPTPKKSDGTSMSACSVAGQPIEPAPLVVTNGDLKDIGKKLVDLAKKEDLEVQAKEQEKVIIAQQTERPLLQQQLLQDKEDEAAEEVEVPGDVIVNGNPQHADHHKVRHSILNNDDRGLDVIEQNLLRVHREFYDQYGRMQAVPAGGRIAELKGEKSPKKRAMTEVVPDVAEIMPRIKSEVLEGAVVVFSGIIPLGVDVQTSDFALWIMSFGAEVATSVNRRTTHVIANPDRKTTKVKSAARYPHIKIVSPEWMFQCCTRWEHVDEGPYMIEIDAAEREGSPIGDFDDESISATGDEADEGEGTTVRLDAMTADSWASVDDELADFLNESETDGGSDSDSESVRSDTSTASDAAKEPKNKRKRSSTNSTDGGDAEESDSSVTSTSRLQRRKKRTLERVTSLANVVTADKSSGLPSPEATGPEEGQNEDEEKAGEVNGSAPDLQEDYDDGLEAELLAGFDDSDGDD